MQIEKIEIFRIENPIRTPFTTAFGTAVAFRHYQTPEGLPSPVMACASRYRGFLRPNRRGKAVNGRALSIRGAHNQ